MIESMLISFGVITSITGTLGIFIYFIVCIVNKQFDRSYLKELIVDTGCLITIICFGISVLEILCVRS